MSLEIGHLVSVKGDEGTIRFIGPTQFAPGTWYGVELTLANGRNDGSVENVRYFTCSRQGNCGIFVRRTLIDAQEGHIDSLVPSSGSARPTVAKSLLQSPAIESLEVSKLHRIIDRLQAKLKIATDDIKQHQEKLSALQKQQSGNELRNELQSRLEMITIEKDYLADSHTKIQQQLHDLQLQYDDLKYDFQILQEEAELNKQIETEVKLELQDSDSPEVQLILTRNKQLEVALVNLQNLMESSQVNLRTEIAQLKAQVAQKQEHEMDYTAISEKLASANEVIASLQSQLDCTLDSEKLIEHFTAENEELSNKIVALTKTVEELSELHELDKSLEENQQVVEEQLRSDIKNLREIIHQNNQNIESLEKKNKFIETRLQQLKLESSQPELVDKNAVLPDENVIFELRKLRLDNISDSINFKIAQAKLDLLTEKHDILPFKTTKHEQALHLLYQLKSDIAYITIISDLLKGTRLLAYFEYLKLQDYLNLILRLCEYNYEMDVFGGELFQQLNTLQGSLFDALDCIKRSNIATVKIDPINEFINHTKLLLDLQHKDYNFKIKFCKLFAVQLAQVEISSYEGLINDIRNHLFNSTEAVQLNSDMAKAASIVTSLKGFILDGLLQMQNIKETNEVVDTQLILEDLFVNWSLSATILMDVYLFRSEENIIDIPKLCSSDKMIRTLKSLVGLFQNYEKLLLDKHQLCNLESSSIYEVLKNEKQVPIDTNNNSKEQQHLQLKLEEVSTLLLDKEQQLQDSELNIQLLQSNMQKSENQRSKQIAVLQESLADSKNVIEMTKKKVEALVLKNEALQNELNELLKSNSVFDVKKFESLASENKNIDKLAYIEEIMFLRKMVVLNFDKSVDTGEDYGWLEEPIIPTIPVPSKTATEFRKSSKSIRELALKTKLIKILNNPWLQRGESAKYSQATKHHKSLQYELFH